MDNSNPRFLQIASIALAAVTLIIGLMLGSQLTTFSNGGPHHLAPSYLDFYVVGLSNTFAQQGEPATVQRALCYSDGAPLAAVQARSSDPAMITRPDTRGAYQAVLAAVNQGGGCPAYLAANPEASGGDGGGLIQLLLGVLLVALVLGGLAWYFLNRRGDDDADELGYEPLRRPASTPPSRSAGSAAAASVAGAAPSARKSAATAALTSDDPQHIGGFSTTYNHGDDTFDKSFIIENANGDFLGECGVSVSESVGSDDGNRNVTAFEIWLFDKNDTQTVTKVIMSKHAFTDDATLAKLAPRGEPMLATLNETIALETNSLIINAEVKEIDYSGMPPTDGVFDRFTIDLSAWVKSDGDLASNDGDASDMLNF